MLGIPKTPKGCSRFMRHDENSVFRRAITPMPKSHFLQAASTLANQIELEGHIPSPPGTRREFIPKAGFTSTPTRDCRRIGEQCSVTASHKFLENPLRTIHLESDEELSFPNPLPHMTSPEPRPRSEPLFNQEQMSPTPILPRPSTAEPVELRKLPLRSPARRRIVTKCTFARTPHCARPTKSWLNRIACFKRED